MIDLLKAKRAFKAYVENYDIENPNIALKISHTYRTMEVARKIAEDLGLNEENIKLAELIGLLHDIGRFEQIKRYNTFSDRKSIDHGDFGVELLFEQGLIKNFIEDRSYDKIIYLAVKNHNKFKIQEGLNEEELLHCKIIRDADKTDIFVVCVEDTKKEEGDVYNYKEIGKQKISEELIKACRENKQIDRKYIVTEIDDYINNIFFLYDYNFLTGLKIIKENQYIEKLIEAVNIHEETKKQFDEILQIANRYIEKRIEEGC
mgnify:CR=1 FL=1